MTTEPTSAFTFGRLVLEAARKMGTAYYGEDGTEPAQPPVDEHDLAEAKRHVNNAVRMFISDAPPTGWKWTHPVYGLTMWPLINPDVTKTVTGGTYDVQNDQTLLTANAAAFYDTMEEKTVILTTNGAVVVKQYVSPTQVYVYGNHYFAAPDTYKIVSDGNYTLPRTFSGTFSGSINYRAATNRATPIEWTNEAFIRQLRENVNIQTGWPSIAAIRPRTAALGRRRYELIAYPIPHEVLGIEINFDLSFDEMVSLTENPPTPIAHDETIRAAVFAVIERDVDGMEGADGNYYRTAALPNSRNIDARSGPRKLGYFGNRRPTITPRNFRDFIRRPNVTFGP
jgi:hypothetical protein